MLESKTMAQARSKVHAPTGEVVCLEASFWGDVAQRLELSEEQIKDMVRVRLSVRL